MAKSKIERLAGISDVQKNGDQKVEEQQFLTITTDLDKKLETSAKEGNRSFIVFESEDPKCFNWHNIDAKGQQTKISFVRRAKGLLERVYLHCRELELEPEIEICTKCKQARVVIRW